jgi:hypothetical protein
MIQSIQPVLVTVMMPARNCEKFLAEAVQSVLQQTHEHFELLIWDDGSDDGTLACAKLFALNDSRIKVFSSTERRGIATTRNLILNEAKGGLLCHVDGDDFIVPNALATMTDAFEADQGLVMAYSDMYMMDSTGTVFSTRQAKDFSRENLAFLGWRHLGMYQTEFARAIGGFNEQLITCEDGDLFMRMAIAGHCKRIPVPLYYYRSHASNTGRTKRKCDECDRLPHCNYYKIWTQAKNEWVARQNKTVNLSVGGTQNSTATPAKTVPVERLQGWRYCANRITPLMAPAVERVERFINTLDLGAAEALRSVANGSVFSYVDTLGGVKEQEIPSGLAVFRLMDRTYTNKLADKLLFGREIDRLDLYQYAPQTYESIEAAIKGAQHSGVNVVFVKGRYGAGGDQIKCVRVPELAQVSLPKDHIVQETVQDIELVEGRKVVIRFYLLIHCAKIYLSAYSFAVVHGERYDPLSDDYDVQIKHAGYVNPDSKVKLIALGDLPQGKDWFQALQVLASGLIPLLDQLRRECPEARYALLGIDGIPCMDGKVRMIEINNFPNMIHTQNINESVNIPMLASVMLKIVTNTLDGSLIEVC